MGGTGTAIGTGLANTNAIIAQNGAGITYAAGLARAHNGGGNNNWYLPSQNELNVLYLNRVAIGGFGSGYYWRSSEGDFGEAWRSHRSGKLGDRFFSARVECFVVPWHEQARGGGFGRAEAIG